MLLQQLLVQRSASFSPGDYLPFMDTLKLKYREPIISALVRDCSAVRHCK